MRKLLIPLLIFVTQFSFSTGNLFHENASLQQTQVSAMDGLSIKYVPAFYWNTIGIQAEYPLTLNFSGGLNVLYALGYNENPSSISVFPDTFLESGIAIDLFGKYYFTGDAPEGFYAYANVSYNSMFYFDGNNRPYTIHSHWKNTESEEFNYPSAFNGGVGAGYQVKILNHLIADVLTGVQLQSGSEGFYYSVYFMPSIGYVF